MIQGYQCHTSCPCFAFWFIFVASRIRFYIMFRVFLKVCGGMRANATLGNSVAVDAASTAPTLALAETNLEVPAVGNEESIVELELVPDSDDDHDDQNLPQAVCESSNEVALVANTFGNVEQPKPRDCHEQCRVYNPLKALLGHPWQPVTHCRSKFCNP